MPQDRKKSLALLHFIVFLWGFTAVLGKGIHLDAPDIVFYRMSIAAASLGLFLLFRRKTIRIGLQLLLHILLGGILLTAHWYTFFAAIKASNVAVTLATMSSGALFVAFIEPIFFKRRVDIIEVVLGFVVIIGLSLIFTVDPSYRKGIYLALLSALFAASFTVYNGKLIRKTNAVVISFYQITLGAILTGLALLLTRNQGDAVSIIPTLRDWMNLIILGTICTAYAFTAGIKVMRHISPYTVALVNNLEPIYGILLALLFFGKSEFMGYRFYLGAGIILTAIVIEGRIRQPKPKSD